MGELTNITYPPAIDNICKVCWKTRDGEVIPLPLIKDSHLRNIALFLMNMGYTKCIARDKTRILWLTVLQIEWERRMAMRPQLATHRRLLEEGDDDEFEIS